MKIRTPPIIGKNVKETERPEFNFNKGKIISSKGRWKSPTGTKRDISTFFHKKILPKQHRVDTLDKKRELCGDFSIKVLDIASPDKPKEIAEELDSKTSMSGGGDFQLDPLENPIIERLLSPSEQLVEELETAHDELQKFKGKRLDDTDFTLVDTITFQDNIQRNLHFRVLEETIHHVKSPKSLKHILDTMNSKVMNHCLTKNQRSQLKQALQERMADLYQPTLTTLLDQQTMVSGNNHERIVAWEQSLTGMHDFVVAVKAINPALLNKKTIPDAKTQDRSLIRNRMEHALQQIVVEMVNMNVGVDKSQQCVQHVNALMKTFVDPVVNATSKGPKKRMQQVWKGLEPGYGQLSHKALSVQTICKECWAQMHALDDLSDTIQEMRKKRNLSVQPDAPKKNKSKWQKEADKLEKEWKSQMAQLKSNINALGRSELPAQNKFVSEFQATFSTLHKMGSEAIHMNKERMAEILFQLEYNELAPHIAFDPQKPLFMPAKSMAMDAEDNTPPPRPPRMPKRPGPKKPTTPPPAPPVTVSTKPVTTLPEPAEASSSFTDAKAAVTMQPSSPPPLTEQETEKAPVTVMEELKRQQAGTHDEPKTNEAETHQTNIQPPVPPVTPPPMSQAPPPPPAVNQEPPPPAPPPPPPPVPGSKPSAKEGSERTQPEESKDETTEPPTISANDPRAGLLHAIREAGGKAQKQKYKKPAQAVSATLQTSSDAGTASKVSEPKAAPATDPGNLLAGLQDKIKGQRTPLKTEIMEKLENYEDDSEFYDSLDDLTDELEHEVSIRYPDAKKNGMAKACAQKLTELLTPEGKRAPDIYLEDQVEDILKMHVPPVA